MMVMVSVFNDYCNQILMCLFHVWSHKWNSYHAALHLVPADIVGYATLRYSKLIRHLVGV